MFLSVREATSQRAENSNSLHFYFRISSIWIAIAPDHDRYGFLLDRKKKTNTWSLYFSRNPFALSSSTYPCVPFSPSASSFRAKRTKEKEEIVTIFFLFFSFSFFFFFFLFGWNPIHRGIDHILFKLVQKERADRCRGKIRSHVRTVTRVFQMFSLLFPVVHIPWKNRNFSSFFFRFLHKHEENIRDVTSYILQLLRSACSRNSHHELRNYISRSVSDVSMF